MAGDYRPTAGDYRSDANGSAYRSAKARFIRSAAPVCALGGEHVDKSLRFPDPGSPTVDHIVPIARGGSARDPVNWQLACLAHNQAKGDRDPYATAWQSDPCTSVDHTSRDHTGTYVPCPRGRGWHPA